jgi:protein-histidine pros-kinase
MNVDFVGMALRANPDAVIIVSATGLVQYWNGAAEQMFGYRAAEAVGQPLRLLLVPEPEHDAFRRQLARALSEPRVVYACVYRRSDGTALHLDVSCRALGAPRSRAEHVLFALKDVTDLKLGGQAAAFVANYGELLEAMPEGILLIAATGLIVYGNAQAQAMFGYSGDELRGMPVERLVPQRHRAAHRTQREDFFSAAPHGPVTNADLYGLRKNESEFPIEVRLNTLNTADGRVALAAVRDVTERKRSELVLKSRILALEAQLRESATVA